MKTRLHFNAFVALALLPALLFAGNPWEGKYTKEKTFHEEYDVIAGATLKIENSYGNIDVTTWDENRIVIDVIVTTNGDNEEKVQRKLDDIDVKFSASSEWVAAETSIAGRKSKSWWSWGNSKSKISMKINYVVKMPESNNIIVNNDYGNINLDTLEGSAKLNCDYGKITTKELMSDDNQLNFDYTKDCYFEYVKGGKINADYSSYTIGKANALEISADYTKSHIETAEQIKYNCDYGSLQVDNSNDVKGSGDYVNVRLGTIYNDVEISADYGSLSIEKMAANAGNVSVKSDYMPITIGLDPGYNFEFDISLSYAKLKGADGFNMEQKREESRKRYYLGNRGGANTSNRILITSDYGNVTFKTN